MRRFLAAAQSIAEEVVAHVSWARDGNPYWLGPAIHDGQVVSRPLGPYLHPGTTGVALFLAAAERSFGGGRYRELCLRSLVPLRRELAGMVGEPTRVAALENPLGGMSGVGSLVYSLLTAGDLLGEPALVHDAQELSRLITPSRISQDQNLDVMFGAAGALLALLALDRRESGPNGDGRTPLELANLCAAHLLGKRRVGAGESRGWPLGPKSMLAEGGFSHGAAGIASALLRLYRRTGDPELLQVAKEGFAYERPLYVREAGHWRLSWRPDGRFVNGWCNGVSGLILGRLALLSGEDPDTDREIETGLGLVCAADLEEDDFVCCGNLGRIDALLQSGIERHDDSLVAAARHLGSHVLARAQERGQFGLMASSSDRFDPRFFLGVSGIGYALLRLADPGLPCVLALS